MQLETNLTTCVHSWQSIYWDLCKFIGAFSFNLVLICFLENGVLTHFQKTGKVYELSDELLS